MIDFTMADVLAARRRIAGVAIETPLVPSPHLSGETGTEVLLKLELASRSARSSCGARPTPCCRCPTASPA